MCHNHNLALTRAFGILIRVLRFAFFSFQLKAVSSEVARDTRISNRGYLTRDTKQGISCDSTATAPGNLTPTHRYIDLSLNGLKRSTEFITIVT
jgi:hypothetical protein